MMVKRVVCECAYYYIVYVYRTITLILVGGEKINKSRRAYALNLWSPPYIYDHPVYVAAAAAVGGIVAIQLTRSRGRPVSYRVPADDRLDKINAN